MRGTVTILLLAAFLGVLAVGAACSIMIVGTQWTQVKEYINIALPAITGLIGSAMGFYFGATARPGATVAETTNETPFSDGETQARRPGVERRLKGTLFGGCA